MTNFNINATKTHRRSPWVSVPIRLILVAIAIAWASSASAGTLMGKNYVGGGLQIMQFGDDRLDRIFGYAYGFEGRANLSTSEYVDIGFLLDFWHATDDETAYDYEISTLSGLGNVTLFSDSTAYMTPYVSFAGGFVRSRAEASGWLEDEDTTETDLAIGVLLGAEMLIGDTAVLNAEISHLIADDTDTTGLELRFSAGLSVAST